MVWNKDELDVWEGFNTVYNGLQRWVTPSINNIVEGDSVNLTYSGHTGINANKYTVTVSSVSNKNYRLPATVSQDWHILKGY